MNSAPQLAFANMSKPTFYKQRDSHLFPSWAYAVTQAVTQLPQSTVETIVFSLVCYWVGTWVWEGDRVGTGWHVDELLSFLCSMHECGRGRWEG